MKVAGQAHELARKSGRPACVAIGMFDGVHLGHQRILTDTADEARQARALSVAVTFDRHPNSVVAPDRTPRLIYSLSQRLRVIEAIGIKSAWVIPFDRAFSEQSAEEFISRFIQDAGPLQSVSIGRNFTFGYRRSGNVATLRTLGERFGFRVHALPQVRWKREVISSTRIREAIQSGELEAASQMLGRPYALCATVVSGDKLGRKLGFPTANLECSGLVLPPTGVYAGYVPFARRRERAVMNIGYRPTVAAGRELRLEVHVLDFHRPLEGRELSFEFQERIRDEQKFASLEALQTQIQSDVQAARRMLRES